MDVITYPHSPYNYPGYSSANYGNANQSSYKRNPAVSKAKKGQDKGLVAAVIILAILLLTVIAALIFVAVLYKQKVAPSTTTAESNATIIIDFSVKRLDMTYASDMGDPESSKFGETCNTFCEMVSDINYVDFYLDKLFPVTYIR
ncbi:hypothetical protein LSH36_1291g00026 [Paralvinella palmiformis]|uniref:Uncharacterized protein n=1 Tax=Paralvinella palmiformis TaxID=53620 RepID=A0AAD9MRQ8_9ANNE|nr:hypothetical protein LSH36_1291g00026 [Paralvinella palmiformis]